MAFIHKAILECDNCGFQREGEIYVRSGNIKINKVVDDDDKWICCDLYSNLMFCSEECKQEYIFGSLKVKKVPIAQEEAL
jgi:hypothetical protein